MRKWPLPRPAHFWNVPYTCTCSCTKRPQRIISHENVSEQNTGSNNKTPPMSAVEYYAY